MWFSRYMHIGFPMSGDEGIPTPDTLLARQVLSQLSYTPMFSLSTYLASVLFSFVFSLLYQALPLDNGLEWTRTIDLTLIRRAL